MKTAQAIYLFVELHLGPHLPINSSMMTFLSPLQIHLEPIQAATTLYLLSLCLVHRFSGFVSELFDSSFPSNQTCLRPLSL